MRDMKSNVDAVVSIAPANLRTTGVTGTGVDLRDFDAATVLVITGACNDGVFSFEVQDSADDVTYAAVADDYLVGTEPTVEGSYDNTVQRVGYVGSKRYIRVVATEGGASPTASSGCIFSAVVLRGLPHIAPVS